MTSFYDERGRRLDLDGKGHSGGEGTVHRIAGDASRVAKIYHPARLNPALETKLRVMLCHPPDDPSFKASRHRSIAWVDGLVFGDASGREFRGFTMPGVDTDEFRQSHEYYDAGDRLRIFGGEFTWRHLFFAAHNLASAVSAVHAAGHRVGDLRETNLLVSPSALVTLIDCDSFQIRDPRDATVHPTRVATGDYLPPELQGVDFRTQHPDRYHGDLFALAVLVFRFLMLGSHPFQSRGPGVADAPTTEAKIRKGVFAFDGRTRGVDPPEYAPPYAMVPSGIRELFARAFVRGHAEPSARPSAAEWSAALAQNGKALHQCGSNPNHWFAHRTCPWCRISPDPFPMRFAAGAQIALNGAASQVPEPVRVEQLRAYARVALADGPVTDAEFWYLRRAGGELGLRAAVIDNVVDIESRNAPQPKPPSAPTQQLPPTMTQRLPNPMQVLAAARDRNVRAAWKAAAPVLAAGAVAGALAPVVAPVASVVAIAVLAVAGEVRSRNTWRMRIAAPWRFIRHLQAALGHAARVVVPLGVLAFTTATYVHEFRPGMVARVAGSLASTAIVWLAITRLPHSSDRGAQALHAGRDLVWRRLTGSSGRMRKPAYAVWALSVAGVAAIATGYALWWPLRIG